MDKDVELQKNMVNVLALNKPWLYLCICSYVAMWLLVWMGNPLLPISSLANYGWAWHHIPEFWLFFFWGCGSQVGDSYLQVASIILI